MIITILQNLSVVDNQKHPLDLIGSRGEAIRISVLDHDLIRVQHQPDGKSRLDRTWMVIGSSDREKPFEKDLSIQGRLRDDLSLFPLPNYKTSYSNHFIQIETELLQINIDLNEFHIQWFNESKQCFASDLKSRAYVYDQSSHTIFHYMERRADEHYFGFGERAGTLDKKGMRMRMQNLDALGYDAEQGDPLYKHFPFYITFIPSLQIAYGLFYDNLATTIFDMGKEVDNYFSPYRYYQADDGDLDYYLIYGPSIKDVVQKFANITGHMNLPPKWSLGYLGSTMTYTEVDNAQEQLSNFVNLCQKHHIPCDLFHLSSGYGSGEEGKRYVFNWNLKKIPDPVSLIDHFHKHGIHVAANIKPALLTSHSRFKEVTELGAFIRSHEDERPELSAFWGGLGAHLDFTNPEAIQWWKQRVVDRILAYGIDATWNDNNEYQIWNDEAECYGFGKKIPIGLIRPLQPLLMTRASYEAQLSEHPEQRPFLISRSGCPGIQRYAQTWSGDNFTSWKTLKYNIPMGLGLSLSGAPNTGHDIGGFAGPKPDPELFVRWIQSGIFLPRFTIHSWNNDGSVNEPWMYPEILPIIRETINFRYRLIPYLYSLFFNATRYGDPIIRPLVYHFPNDKNCHTQSFEFMLGSNLLIATIFNKGDRIRKVYLPKEQDWFDFYTGEVYQGGQTIEIPAPLEYTPILVPAGGIIPMGKLMWFVGESPDDERNIHLFPHPIQGKSTFTLFEDDGMSNDYKAGGYTEILIELDSQPDIITLKVHYRNHGFPLPYPTIEFELPENEMRPIIINGSNPVHIHQHHSNRISLPVSAII
jgi:alpha-glucosidase